MLLQILKISLEQGDFMQDVNAISFTTMNVNDNPVLKK